MNIKELKRYASILSVGDKRILFSILKDDLDRIDNPDHYDESVIKTPIMRLYAWMEENNFDHKFVGDTVAIRCKNVLTAILFNNPDIYVNDIKKSMFLKYRNAGEITWIRFTEMRGF